MTDTYFDYSIPPSVLPYAKGATAGVPRSFTPAGSIAPASPAELAAGRPVAVTANPATPWTAGQYVQTATAGAAGRASWSGTSWVSGAAPAAEGGEPPADPEPTEPAAEYTAVPVDEIPSE